jgi:hypothetical protein
MEMSIVMVERSRESGRDGVAMADSRTYVEPAKGLPFWLMVF